MKNSEHGIRYVRYVRLIGDLTGRDGMRRDGMRRGEMAGSVPDQNKTNPNPGIGGCMQCNACASVTSFAVHVMHGIPRPHRQECIRTYRTHRTGPRNSTDRVRMPAQHNTPTSTSTSTSTYDTVVILRKLLPTVCTGALRSLIMKVIDDPSSFRKQNKTKQSGRMPTNPST